MSNETQLLTEDLEVGSFYWLRVLNDPDAEDWEMKPMPARYAGDGKWNFLGCEGETEWKVWVSSKIEEPDAA